MQDPSVIFVALALAEAAPSVFHRDTGVAPSSIRTQKCSAAVFGMSESNRGKCQAFSSLVFHLILRDLGYRLNCGVIVGLFRFGSLSKQKLNFVYKCNPQKFSASDLISLCILPSHRRGREKEIYIQEINYGLG